MVAGRPAKAVLGVSRSPRRPSSHVGRPISSRTDRRGSKHLRGWRDLPKELLLAVFHLLKPNPSADVNNGIRNLIVVTHVCTRFRAVALSDVALWDVVPFHDVSLTTALLHRSRDLSIVLISHSTGAPGTALLRMVEDTFSTRAARELHLAHPERVLRSLIQCFMSSTSPGLQALSMKCLVSDTRGGGQLAFDVPRALLQREAPSVRKLVFSDCTLDWNFPRFPKLTAFELEGVPEIARPSQSELVNLLSNMPVLEKLVINDALPQRKRQRANATASVRLKRLRMLSLMGDSEDVASVLRWEPEPLLRFPAMAKLHLTCTKASRAFKMSEETRKIMQRVRKHILKKDASASLESIAFDNLTPGQLRVVGYSSSQVPMARGQESLDESAELCLTLEWSSDRSDGRARTDAIFVTTATLAVPSLRALFVSDSHCEEKALWLGFPHLELAGARGRCALGLFHALGSMEVDPSKTPWRRSPSPDPSFPRLRVIILEDVDFSWTTDDGEQAGKLLVRMLGEREANGGVLDELEIRDCPTAEPALLDELRETAMTLTIR